MSRSEIATYNLRMYNWGGLKDVRVAQAQRFHLVSSALPHWGGLKVNTLEKLAAWVKFHQPCRIGMG